MARRLVELHPEALADWRSCAVRPGRREFFYLATKTFGVNLAVRTAFAMTGHLTAARAAFFLCWYQAQDAAFTVFGRSYLNLLGRVSGVLTIARAKVGDMAFIYIQCCAFEMLNRAVLGPVGNTPAVWTLAGVGFVLFNVFQGMVSGGPILPAINQAKRAGLIGERTAFHCYQLADLTMHVGLLATFGHQLVHAWVTGVLCLFCWSLYLGCAALARQLDAVTA